MIYFFNYFDDMNNITILTKTRLTSANKLWDHRSTRWQVTKRSRIKTHRFFILFLIFEVWCEVKHPYPYMNEGNIWYRTFILSILHYILPLTTWLIFALILSFADTLSCLLHVIDDWLTQPMYYTSSKISIKLRNI